MTVKKSYNVGDTVWIYGVHTNNLKSTKGEIVKSFTIDYEGFNNEIHYLVAVPTEIEYLLEVRTWHTISQDEDGHVGSLRLIANDLGATRKMVARTGMQIISEDSDDEPEPSADEIHAALEKSQKDASHMPLVMKENKPRRRNFARKKKV